MIAGNNIIINILKNFINDGNDDFKQNSLKLPTHFTAMVKKIENNFALIEWKGRTFPVKTETPVKEGKMLLLQLKEENQEKQFYRILARSPAEVKDSDLFIWQVMLNLKGKMSPLLLKVNYFQNKKRSFHDEPKGPSLEIGVQTRNLGFVVIRMSSFTKPYNCRFLVDKKGKGELLEKGISKLIEHMEIEGIPIKILPFRVILPAEMDRIKSNAFLDKKA